MELLTRSVRPTQRPLAVLADTLSPGLGQHKRCQCEKRSWPQDCESLTHGPKVDSRCARLHVVQCVWYTKQCQPGSFRCGTNTGAAKAQRRHHPVPAGFGTIE